MATMGSVYARAVYELASERGEALGDLPQMTRVICDICPTRNPWGEVIH